MTYILVAACIILVLLPCKYDPAIRLKLRIMNGHWRYDK